MAILSLGKSRVSKYKKKTKANKTKSIAARVKARVAQKKRKGR